ncbi:hypothetical protein QTP88_013417 [Uroleucon formosanum]
MVAARLAYRDAPSLPVLQSNENEMSVEAEHGGCWDSCVRLMCHNHSSSQPSNHRHPYSARHLYANGNKNGLNGHIKGECLQSVH